MLENLILFVPFIVLFLILHYAKSHQNKLWLIKTAYTIIFGAYLLTAIVSLILVFRHYPPLTKETLQNMGLCLVSVAALLMIIPEIRTKISLSIPIDAKDPIHTVTLSLSFLVFIQFILTAFSLEEISKQADNGTSLSDLWSQDILLALLALVGVGWGQKRSTREVFARLGLVRPKLTTILTGIGFAIFFVMINIVLEAVSSATGIGIDPNVDKVTDQMLGPLFHSIPGILTLGLAAALGEELIFRGALLPRFGLVYTSILFTLVHSNYGISIATVVVFILALSLGILRKRFSTTLTMVTHASYNIILGVITLLGSHIT